MTTPTRTTKKKSRWYPVSKLGIVSTTLYALVPPYILYTQSTNSFPEVLRLPLVAAMLLILACMLVSRRLDFKPFHKKPRR